MRVYTASSAHVRRMCLSVHLRCGFQYCCRCSCCISYRHLLSCTIRMHTIRLPTASLLYYLKYVKLLVPLELYIVSTQIISTRLIAMHVFRHCIQSAVNITKKTVKNECNGNGIRDISQIISILQRANEKTVYFFLNLYFLQIFTITVTYCYIHDVTF